MLVAFLSPLAKGICELDLRMAAEDGVLALVHRLLQCRFSLRLASLHKPAPSSWHVMSQELSAELSTQ